MVVSGFDGPVVNSISPANPLCWSANLVYLANCCYVGSTPKEANQHLFVFISTRWDGADLNRLEKFISSLFHSGRPKVAIRYSVRDAGDAESVLKVFDAFMGAKLGHVFLSSLSSSSQTRSTSLETTLIIIVSKGPRCASQSGPILSIMNRRYLMIEQHRFFNSNAESE